MQLKHHVLLFSLLVVIIVFGYKFTRGSSAEDISDSPYPGRGEVIINGKRQPLDSSVAENMNLFAGKVLLFAHKGKDYKKAFDIFSSLANRNNPDAYCMLGYMYENGKGIAENNYLAEKYYKEAIKLAVDAKNIESEADALGYLAEFMLNKKNNYEEGVKYLKEAAEKGNKNMQYKLAKCYLKGKFKLEVNNKKALYWLEKSANQTEIAAIQDLSIYYYQGKIVPKDMIKAYKWAYVASHNTGTRSKRNLEQFASIMTEKEIETAKSEAESWMNKHTTVSGAECPDQSNLPLTVKKK